MAELIDIQLAGHSFQLLANCGLFWPAQSMLFVADTHFGKEATFRSHGIPVPIGATAATLAKIAEMLRRTGAERLCILGDMFHARSSIVKDVRESLDRFFDEFKMVEVSLILGNHDTHLGTQLSSWPIKILEAGTTICSITLAHLPTAKPEGADLVLCGHIHPAIRVSSNTERFGKLPCFWHSRGQLVLPAIGDFTGTQVVRLAKEEQAWFIADQNIYRAV